MKVLLMTSLWGQHGGKEQYVQCCIDEFARMGHECILAYGRKSLEGEMLGRLPIRQYRLDTYSTIRSARDNKGAAELTKLLRDEAPDIIFMCDVRNLALLNVLKNYGGLVTMSHDNWLSCMRGTCTTYFRRSICTHNSSYRCLLHGCFVRKNPVGAEGRFNSLSDQEAVLESHRGITVHVVASHYMKERLVQHGFDPHQVRVVGCFTEMLLPVPQLTENDHTPSIAFVGRIDRYKGVDYLMRALAQLLTPFRCSVIGDGPYLPYCKALSRSLGIRGLVDFTGWLSRDKLAAPLTKSTVIVVPSIWPEPFGLVGLEAMTCSKPVVAFDVGGISEWLRDGTNGYLVPVKSVAVLAQRIDSLLRDKRKAAGMGAEGLRMVKTFFSKESHFEHLFSAFELAAWTKRGNRSGGSRFPILSS